MCTKNKYHRARVPHIARTPKFPPEEFLHLGLDRAESRRSIALIPTLSRDIFEGNIVIFLVVGRAAGLCVKRALGYFPRWTHSDQTTGNLRISIAIGCLSTIVCLRSHTGRRLLKSLQCAAGTLAPEPVPLPSLLIQHLHLPFGAHLRRVNQPTTACELPRVSPGFIPPFSTASTSTQATPLSPSADCTQTRTTTYGGS